MKLVAKEDFDEVASERYALRVPYGVLDRLSTPDAMAQDTLLERVPGISITPEYGVNAASVVGTPEQLEAVRVLLHMPEGTIFPPGARP